MDVADELERGKSYDTIPGTRYDGSVPLTSATKATLWTSFVSVRYLFIVVRLMFISFVPHTSLFFVPCTLLTSVMNIFMGSMTIMRRRDVFMLPNDTCLMRLMIGAETAMILLNGVEIVMLFMLSAFWFACWTFTHMLADGVWTLTTFVILCSSYRARKHGVMSLFYDEALT